MRPDRVVPVTKAEGSMGGICWFWLSVGVTESRVGGLSAVSFVDTVGVFGKSG